jgi:alpha-methylacyl-CoA racemase
MMVNHSGASIEGVREVSGPLTSVKVIEMAGIGPAPFCAMMLADMGAEVIRVDRRSFASTEHVACDPLLRSRRSIALNLKHPDAVNTLLRLIENADVFIEGFRPGVTERLGLGPSVCLQRNPRLVYGRMTGWGQDGPLAAAAGHDINYIALSGALHLIGAPGGKPVPPLNLIGDFGGGGMLLAAGVLAALLEARASGRGQVVDAAMVDGTIALLGMMFGMRAETYFRDATGENLYAGDVPFYGTYQTKDGKYVAIGSLEPQFYALLLDKLGLGEQFAGLGFATVDDPEARERWPALRTALESTFRTRTRDEWCQLLEGSDVCFAPVLTLAEAASHPHNVARQNFVEIDGVVQNAPAPRFSRTKADTPVPARRPGEDTETVLRAAGFSEPEIERLRTAGALS